MRKGLKRFLLAVLVGMELAICAAILLSLTVLSPDLPTVRLFYAATVRAEKTIEERVPVDMPSAGRPLDLRLDNVRGDVRVVPGQEGEVVLHAVVETWGQDRQDAEAKLEKLQVRTETGDGTLTVRVEEESEFYLVSLVARPSRVTFDLAVPENTYAHLSTRDGAVRVRRIDGGVELANRYGPVSVEDVPGDVSIDAREEDVTVLRSGAPDARVELKVRFADLTVGQVRAGELRVENRDGAVRLEDVAVDGPLAVEARFGGVELARVQAASIRVEVNDDRLDLADVRSAGALDIAAKFGEVSVNGVAADTLVVDAHDGSLTLQDVEIGQDGTITSRYVTVQLRDVRARSFTVTGHDRDIELENVRLEDELDVSSKYGAVRVSGTTARAFEIETRDDPIVLEGASGPLWLRNHYGDVTVTGAQEVTLDVNVQDGAFSFEGSLDPRADHDIEGTYGDVDLALPEDTAVRLDAQSRYGRIRCELPVAVEEAVDEQEASESDQSRLVGSIHGGRAGLRIRVRDGDITITEAP